MKSITQRVNERIKIKFDELWTAIPCIITRVDRTNMRCDVKPKMKFSEFELPKIKNIPVVFPRGSDSIILMPIKKDDIVLVLFSKYDLSKLLVDNNINLTVDINQFHFRNAFVLGGFVLYRELGSSIVHDEVYEIPENDIKIISDKEVHITAEHIRLRSENITFEVPP